MRGINIPFSFLTLGPTPSSKPVTADDRHDQEVLVTTVYNAEFPAHFTNAELDRARRAGVLHRSIHHPCDTYLYTINDNGTMVSIYVTSKDLQYTTTA